MSTSSKRPRRALRFALWSCLIGFIALNVLAYQHATSMLHYTTGGPRTERPESITGFNKLATILSGVNVPRPYVDLPSTKLHASCQALTLVVEDKIKLSCWYVNKGSDTPLVILFHGYTADKTSLLGEAKALLKQNLSVLLVDFRGSGGSSESYTTLGAHESRDVAAVYRYAKSEFPHQKRILYGSSMGAAAILRALATQEINPDAVILAAVYDNMLNTIRNRFSTMNLPSFPAADLLVFWGGKQLNFNGFKLNPVEYAQHIPCPALFLHGDQDPRATIEDAKRVYDAAPQPKQFHSFTGAGHVNYIRAHEAEWNEVVMRFVDRSTNIDH